MGYKRIGLGTFVLLALLCSTGLMSGIGFFDTPSYVDPSGDNSPAFADIMTVWIDNDATYLRFKLDLNGSIIQEDEPYYAVYISVDNNTGQDYGWDLPIDYGIYFQFWEDASTSSYFDAIGNSSNNYDNPIGAGLMYFQFTNNNYSVEFGYKLHTSAAGTGFLNASLGQTIYLRFRADYDSDDAPDSSLPLIRYVLTEEGGIPGFDFLFLSLAVLAVVAFALLEKKLALI